MKKTHASTRRENREPGHRLTSVPFGLVLLIVALSLGCLGYFAANSGGFRADVFGPENRAVAPGTGASLGKRIYVQNCIVCHQASGRGIPRLYPPLAQSEWVLGKSWVGENHLVKIVLNGLHGPTEINNQRYVGAMVPWEKVLNDEEIAAVLSYIRGEWGNDAPPISPEFVAEVRARNLSRNREWTQPELRAIPKND
ncbi:MAG TPA: cytochrome c [Chthoniobacterales bacterium]